MRSKSVAALVFASLLPPAIYAMQADDDRRLEESRRALTGERKDTAKARKLLLEIVQARHPDANPATLVWARIYLGYIEDRAGSRENAISWYEQALKIGGAPAGGLAVARSGLQQPLVWIRHLDDGQPQPRPVSPEPTPKLAANLSAKERRENFEALWSMIDANYAHFQLKSLNWAEVGRRYRAKLDAVTGDDEFYRMLFQLVAELKDTHSWLQNYRAPAMAGVPGMPVDLFQGKPYVTAGDKAGWEVLSVDGLTPAAKMEALRPHLRGFSSERAFERQAARMLLADPAAERAVVVLRSPGGEIETLELARASGSAMPNRPVLPAGLTSLRFVHFGRLPSGLGYIRIDSFNGRQEIDGEFHGALEQLRDTPALILDIRDNPGGFGHPEIAGRFFEERALAGFSFTKDGPGHADLVKRAIYVEPSGAWHYTRPVALLVNDVTGSASDLFACEMRSARRVLTVGSTTHGNLSGVAFTGTLPCGLAVRISNGYISDASGRPIEVNGNAPDVAVEPGIRDALEGRDPVLARAVELLTAPRAR